jgi:hypothetical protein
MLCVVLPCVVLLCVTNKPIMLSAVILSVMAEESMVDGHIEKWPDTQLEERADRHKWANRQLDGHIDK